MSFVIRKTLQVNKSYPELLLEIPGATEDVDVTYEVIALERMAGTTATVWYTFSVDGVTSGWKRQFDFQYDGTGSPIEEGERALKSYLGTP
ncbi:hypothetical protein V6E20_10765 [Serratia marcescens]|uniref:hypothetical protein n=1 Tax=Serratia marcescens TaxID=615 RepID=UPI002FD8E5B2